MMSIPRGIRNNNPGNIEYTGTQWKGLADPPTDGRFCRFIDPEHGIRALARVIRTYYEHHSINTIRGVINRWAPPVENDTTAYIAHVSEACGVGADQSVDPTQLSIITPLISAIITHENGQQPYDMKTLRDGVLMA
jgi:hypothetical protein